jgi:superfamily II RNA helicase
MLHIHSGKCSLNYNKTLLDLPFEPDHFQKYSFHAIDKNESVLVTAHTGSGKTLVAEYAIKHNLQQNKRILYTAPIKSLSNQKFNDFIKLYSIDRVGIMTGDNKINPDADIVILTTEILRNSLYEQNNELLKNVGCVIFDEVHYINDQDRGTVWEESLMLLSNKIQLILLSATIDHPDMFAKWLCDTKQMNIHLIPTSHRVVPLKHFIFVNNELYPVLDNCDKFNESMYIRAIDEYKKYRIKKKTQYNMGMFHDLMKFLHTKELNQTILFCFSRKKCEQLAEQVAMNYLDSDERHRANTIFMKYMYKYKSQYEYLHQYQLIYKLIQNGICFHHSGLLPLLKDVIEILFSEGLIKVLFATETFAVGINMPTRTVVFMELEKYTNYEKRLLNTSEYKQMSGRAGRRGKDIFGNVIIFPYKEIPSQFDLKQVMMGKIAHIESKFEISPQFYLKTMNSNSTNFIESSLLYMELDKQMKDAQSDLDLYSSEWTSLMPHYNSEIHKYLELKCKLDEMAFQIIKPNKNDLKLLSELKSTLQQYNVDKLTEVYKKKKNKECELLSLQTYIETTLKSIEPFLIDLEYITPNKQLLAKGMLAKQIYECNPFLLTEILTRGMFDDLTCEEIVGFIGIFIDDDNEDDSINVISSEIIINKTIQVEEIIEIYLSYENKYGCTSKPAFWKISYLYAEIGYMWASQISLKEIIETYNVYEGNFVKNMIKIHNIIEDIVLLCEMSNKPELIPRLKKSMKLILRDVVSADSIYLMNI